MKQELQQELERRKLRKARRDSEKADGRSDDFWQKRHKEVELDWGEKLDMVSDIEEKVAARLEEGLTKGVLKRLDKNENRIDRLIRRANKLLKEVRR